MMGKLLHQKPLWVRAICCFSLILVLCCFVFVFFPHAPSLKSSPHSALIFEKPDFNQPPKDPDEEPQANQGYRIEHTPRGLIRFRTEVAGSPAFGTPVPEILPYDPRAKLGR